jgi:hypothetical protein
VNRFTLATPRVLATCLIAASSLLGCAGGDGSSPAPLGADARPALGVQIDRAGRPAVSTALIATFAPFAERNDVRDRYNQAGPAAWASFMPEMTFGLGVLDALDGSCGTQLLVGTGPNRYDALAGILLDDRLYVNSASGVCGVYLGLEGEVVGALEPGDGGCGGRTPNDDVIERSYSVLAAGALSGVDDLVSEDARDHSTEVFPFIAGPN